MNTPDLKAYAVTPYPPALVPASPQRAWMDRFPDRHAYRCLPLSIANAHGWCLLSPCSFEVEWNGGPRAQDLQAYALDDYPFLDHLIQSNFTHGILTFHTGYLFRTSPGWNLYATGPVNHVKDGATPLTGIIESDWLPYPFTMNWHFSRPGRVSWRQGEPFCMVFPVPARSLEDVSPEILDLSQAPELEREYRAWREKREDFMKRFNAGDEATIRQAWQRYYFLGQMPSTGDLMEQHLNKLRLKTPEDRRQKP